jgi:murein DD-endopeptidase MepM/ murein hydrolase activator NlpD
MTQTIKNQHRGRVYRVEVMGRFSLRSDKISRIEKHFFGAWETFMSKSQKSQGAISTLLFAHWLVIGGITTALPLGLQRVAQAEVIIDAPNAPAAENIPIPSEPVSPPAPVNPVVEAPAAAPVIIDPAPVDVGPAAQPYQPQPNAGAPELSLPQSRGGARNGATPGYAETDPENYSLGATTAPTPTTPRQVVLNERSTGCQAVLQAQQSVPTSICDPAALPPAHGPSRYVLGQAQYPGWGRGAPAYPAYPSAGFNLGNDLNLAAYLPRGLGGNALGWFRQAGKAMRFPLLMPAAITSAFGWRLHPITGNQRFHNGIDLGAETGAPVVAVHDGQVVTANAMGGYGLTVIIDHHKPAWQTLYAHLSQLAVQPGQPVRQGDLIGFVGSTGNSTGPHLHFEILQQTPEGPVAINPGMHMQFALAELIQALRTAQAKPAQTQPSQPTS